MLNQYKRTYKAVGNGKSSYVNRVEVEIYYNKGGMNYWYGKPEQRGYYFGISGHHIYESNGIVSIETHLFGGAQGIKCCVVPCERQSKKRYESAKAQIDELTDRFLGQWLVDNDIILESLEYEVEESDLFKR